MPPALQYDGTFEGLLTAMDRLLHAHIPQADIRPPATAAPDLFDSPERVETHPEAAAQLSARLEQVAPGSLHQVLYAFLAEDVRLGGALYTYVRTTLQRGECVDGYLTHPDIRRVMMTARRVGGESHRLKGLLRFRELRTGSLWAPVEPDANVILLLALHFRRRLATQEWTIHDLKRHVAVSWDRRDLEWLEGDGLRGRLTDLRPDELSASEADYQQLWRQFFRSIAIPERLNPELQRRNMPRRYWKHLIEK